MTSTGLIIGIVLIVVYVIFWRWHSQGSGKLTKEEIDNYISIIEKLPIPEEEIQAIVSRLRPWAEADDGKPVYMFNMIHFFDEVRMYPDAPEFKGTPDEANNRYMKGIIGLWLRHASYPMIDGAGQRPNLINIEPERDWAHATVARYPNRRTFLKLNADPAYAPCSPYKFMSMELDLLPITGKIVVPDLRLLVGGVFLITFFAINWIIAVV